MKEKNIILATFATLAELDDALRKLEKAQPRVSDVSILMSHAKSLVDVGLEPEVRLEGAASGGTIGGAFGGLLGGLSAVGTVAIVSPSLLVMGPIVATLAGAGLGALLGGISGGLIGLGVSEAEDERFER